MRMEETTPSKAEVTQATRSTQSTKLRIAELELTVQMLQHRLRIFEGPRAVEDDVELVDENQTIEGDQTELDGGNLPHPKEIRGYLRCDQPRESPREMPTKDRHEQGREEWYDCRGSYDGRDYNEEPYQERYRS